MKSVDYRVPWGRPAEDVLALKRDATQQSLHVERVLSQRKLVDDQTPNCFSLPHLYTRAKKVQLETARRQKIATDNSVLMTKLVAIMNEERKNEVRRYPHLSQESRATQRRKKALKLQKDNRRIADGIKQQNPYYSNAKLAEAEKDRQHVLKTMSRSERRKERARSLKRTMERAGTILYSANALNFGGGRGGVRGGAGPNGATAQSSTTSGMMGKGVIFNGSEDGNTPPLVLRTAKQMREEVARARGGGAGGETLPPGLGVSLGPHSPGDGAGGFGIREEEDEDEEDEEGGGGRRGRGRGSGSGRVVSASSFMAATPNPRPNTISLVGGAGVHSQSQVVLEMHHAGRRREGGGGGGMRRRGRSGSVPVGSDDNDYGYDNDIYNNSNNNNNNSNGNNNFNSSSGSVCSSSSSRGKGPRIARGSKSSGGRQQQDDVGACMLFTPTVSLSTVNAASAADLRFAPLCPSGSGSSVVGAARPSADAPGRERGEEGEEAGPRESSSGPHSPGDAGEGQGREGD